MRLKKKDLLKSPVRKWDETSREYSEILLVPAGTKHDSGFMHIAIIGVYEENKYEICGFPDDISCYFPMLNYGGPIGFDRPLVRMDCYYPSGVLRYHGNGTFKVSEAISSQDITFTPQGK
jgi:hypothetical protein